MNKFIKQAFTLIELLVVIAIIGILSGLIVVSMSGVTQKANLTKAQVFNNSLRNALMANIIGEWKMDEGSGTSVNDTWGGLSNGTLYNFADTTAGYGDTHTSGWVSSSNCVSGTCLKFDGSNDYVASSGSSLDIDSGLINSNEVFFAAMKTTGNMTTGLATNSTYGSLTDWVNVVGTYNDSVVKIYINGVQQTTSSSSTSNTAVTGLNIGRRSDSAQYWNG